MAKRSNGEGTKVKFRNGRWYAAISAGYDEHGKRLRKWIYGAKEGDVVKEIARLRKQQLDGVLVKTSRMKLCDWLTHWLKNIAPYDPQKPCRHTTITGYEKIVRLYIAPHLAGKQLTQLSGELITAWHGELRRSGIGEGTVRTAHSILSRALNVAMRKGMVAFNACQIAGRPGLVTTEEMKSLSPEKANLFVKQAASDRLYALYVLAVTCGMRQGELFGLKREDIDLDGATLTVRRTLVHSDGLFVENPPKSRRGNRTIALSAIAVDALRDHFRRMLKEGNAGSEYVFCTHLGTPLWRSNVRRKSLRPILKAAGLAEMRFHDLRHSSASIMLSLGENPHVVAQRLGHDVATLMKTYAHVLPGMDKAAAAKFDTLLGNGTAG